MTYEIYIDEILKVHSSYYIEADSEEEARKKFENKEYNELPSGDIYDSEIIGYEILKYED